MKQMSFENNEQLKIHNVMTCNNCHNIIAALRYVSENPKSLSLQGVREIQSYITEQIKSWKERSCGKLTHQDIMYGLIRSNMVLHAEGEEVRPVDVRYAVEHPMRISQLRYGVRSGDEQAVLRVAFLIDMLFDKNGKNVYETQRLFLNGLVDKLIQDEREDNLTTNAMVKVLLSGMKRSMNEQDCWSVEHDKGEAVSGDIQMSEPRLLVTNKKSLDMRSSKREQNKR